MEGLNGITQFKTGSTIANGMELSTIAVNKYKASIEGLSLSQAKTALSTTALNEAQQNQILTSAGLLKTTESLTLAEVKEMASSMSLSAQKKEEILTTLQGAIVENEWNEEKLEAIVASGGETGAIAQVILAKKAENAENLKGIAGRKALTASLWGELKARLALMATNPAVWIAGIIGAGIGLVALQEKLTKSLDECVDELEEYNSEFESAQSEAKSLETELDSCRTRFEELQNLADNGTISIIEQEELNRLKETNEELDRNLRIQKEKAQLSAIEGAKSADETLNKKVESKYVRGDVESYEGVVLKDQILSVSPKDELEASIEEYNKLQEQIDTLKQSYDNGSISADDYNKQLTDLTDQQTKARTRASEMSDILVESEKAYKNLENTGGKLTTTQSNNLKAVENANTMYNEFLGTIDGIGDAFETQYENAIHFFDQEGKNVDEITQKYNEAVKARKELYSGSNYVGNVDINNRPVVVNDDGSYSTTSTSFQEKWVGDEETGSYKIIHFTPILPDGTILEGEALNNYIDKILNASDSLEADKTENGGYGIVYKVDTEVNGKKITDDNLEEAFGIADAWDVEMHNLQDKMYADEAELKIQLENFGEGSKVNLGQFFEDNSINTTEELDYWNKIARGAKTAEEAVRMYNEAKSDSSNETDNFTSTISSSISQLATQLEPQFAELGEAYKAIFTDEGFTLDDVDNSMLENLRKSFAEIEEEVGVAFDKTKLDPFFDALTNSNSTVEQVQQAFNDLATAYFYSTDTLEQLNAENADAIEKQLEEMGVANANEVVAAALAEKELELAVAKEYLAQTSKELANATGSEIAQFAIEQIAAGECSEALALFYLKKVLLNTTTISTSADVNNILTLARAASLTTDSLLKLEKAKSTFDSAIAAGDGRSAGEAWASMQATINEVKNDVANFTPIEMDFSNIGGGASSAGGAGKEAGDAYVEAFEEELDELDRLKDQGKLTEKEYLDQLRVNIYALFYSNVK